MACYDFQPTTAWCLSAPVRVLTDGNTGPYEMNACMWRHMQGRETVHDMWAMPAAALAVSGAANLLGEKWSTGQGQGVKTHSDTLMNTSHLAIPPGLLENAGPLCYKRFIPLGI